MTIEKKNKLNLGCGNDIRKGFVNVDCKDFGGNQIIDLDKFPWPLKANTFDYVLANHVLEHLTEVVKVMEEIYRICKPNAVIKISSPHYASDSIYTDPTHKKGFSYRYFEFFSKKLGKVYCDYQFKCNFDILNRRIDFPPHLAFIKPLAHKFPRFFDTNLSFIFRPTNLKIKLKAVKS